MTIDELKEGLKEIKKEEEEHYDLEMTHGKADNLLLKFIDSAEVTKLFNDLNKWYA